MLNDVNAMIYENIFNSLNQPIWVKDTNLNYIRVNAKFIELTQMLGKNIIGKNDFDMPWEQHASEFRQSNKQVLQENNLVVINPIVTQRNELKTVANSITPLRDNDNTVTGIISIMEVISDIGLMKHLITLTEEDYKRHGIKQYSKIISKQTADLSPQELKVIYFLLRGKTTRLISLAMNLSPRTVESYMERIKVKFNSRTKPEIIETALALGYLNYIPHDFISLS